jgi:cytidine deaminase
LKSKNDLIHDAKNALIYSYSKYSQFKVGAALLTKDGKVFTGCNIENISYGLSICAERVAVFKAVSEGFTEFESIGIASSSNAIVFPCGACRQVLAEFNPTLKIYLERDNETYSLEDLIPHVFNNKLRS